MAKIKLMKGTIVVSVSLGTMFQGGQVKRYKKLSSPFHSRALSLEVLCSLYCVVSVLVYFCEETLFRQSCENKYLGRGQL